MKSSDKSDLSHVDASGNVRMVNVAQKDPSVRTATATADVTFKPEVLKKMVAGTLKKGEALTAAKLAGIAAAKRTGELIPLCHPLALDWVDVQCDPVDDAILRVIATAQTTARTGVEMEAMTAAAVAALTLYDMAKAADKSIVIGPIQLESKTGGKSGDYRRSS